MLGTNVMSILPVLVPFAKRQKYNSISLNHKKSLKLIKFNILMDIHLKKENKLCIHSLKVNYSYD